MTGLPLAILTPMANPTVEAEMRRLLPPDVAYVIGRLVSRERGSLDRLRAYAETVADALDQFGGLALRAIGFACTGSGYLVGRAREDELAATLPVPMLWATRAIAAALEARGVKRLAVVSPYPSDLHDAGLRYWADSGFEVIHNARVEIGSNDTRWIYRLGEGAARPALADALAAGPDAVLLSGTGMPTLALLEPDGAPPVLSSNYCLARALLQLETGKGCS